MRPALRRLVAPIVVLPLILAMAGCSRTATYEDGAACSIGTEAVTAILDTDRFTADDQSLPDLPGTLPEAGYVGPNECFAEGGDTRLRARVDIVGAAEVEELQTQFREGESVELDEGVASIGSNRAVWACGAIVLALDVNSDDPSEQVSVDEPTMRAAITDLAEAVSCPTYEGP